MRKLLLLTLVMMIAVSSVMAQQRQEYTVFNRKLTEGGGVIKLDTANNDGIAWLNGESFTYGDIDVDIKGQDVYQQSFVGFAFHGKNDSTFECIYFRPFNFKADDPERHVHQVQYVALPKYDWPYLREKYHNQYEKAIPQSPDPNNWFHARIHVEKEQISVYVNGSSTPALIVKPLVPLEGTKIGYWVGNGSPGEWKGLRVIEKFF